MSLRNWTVRNRLCVITVSHSCKQDIPEVALISLITSYMKVTGRFVNMQLLIFQVPSKASILPVCVDANRVHVTSKKYMNILGVKLRV